MEPLLNLLMVDDDHNDLALFGIAVDKTDLNIWLQTATDGQQAIEYLQGSGPYADRSLHPLPDLVVTDLKLSLVSGFEFLEWRNGSEAWKLLPVVLFTASANKTEIERAMAMGANLYMAKPTTFDGWKKAVQEIWDFGLVHQPKS